MTPDDFRRYCLSEFGFLMSEFSFSHAELNAGPGGCTMTFESCCVAVRVSWEHLEYRASVDVYKIEDGRRMSERIDLGSILALRAPELRSFPDYWDEPRSDEYTLRQLSEMAGALSSQASDLLRGDFSVSKEITRFFAQPACLGRFDRPKAADAVSLVQALREKGNVSPGDIFAIRLISGDYLYGRVIKNDARVGDREKLVLVYIYNVISDRLVDIPTLDRADLLMPPVITCRTQWQFDYFRTLCNTDLRATDILPAHCFKDSKGVYRDEYGSILPCEVEPCGIFAALCYGMLDIAVSKALKWDQIASSFRESTRVRWWQRLWRHRRR